MKGKEVKREPGGLCQHELQEAKDVGMQTEGAGHKGSAGGVGERGGWQQHIERQRSLVSHKGYYPRNVTPKGQRLLLSTSLDDMLSRQQNVPKTHGGRSGGLVGVPGIFTSRQATLTG